ncbi:MAG: RNA polymerase sigma factor [Thermoanaerobaculia bacterium]
MGEIEATPAVPAEASWGEALRPPFEALARGDAEALEAVWGVASRRLWALALWRTGRPEDASDVVQEVFFRLASRREELARVAAPHTWLLAVTHHAAVDLVRRRGRQRTEPLESAGFVEAPAHDPARRVEAERVSRHLSRLPAPQREAVALRHVEGYSYREIGRITGVPTFTAASRCRLGLSRLRRLMEGVR